MNIPFKIFLLFLLPVTISFGQCNNYFQFSQGNTWSYENYDGKDKLQGSQKQEVVSYTEAGNGFNSTLKIWAYDKKGKESTQGEIEIKCENGIILFDMNKFVSQQQMEALKSYDLKVIAEDLEYPSNPAPGSKLKDGKITVTATNSPIPMNMVVKIVDREVVGKESVTVPGGNYNCVKIKSKTLIENQMGVNMKFEYDQVEWIADKLGMVKNESYDKGKLKGYTVLTSYKE